MLALLLGCGSALVRTVDFDRELSELGTVHGLAAPHATGPLPAPTRPSLEGAVSLGAGSPPMGTRPEGAPGTWAVRHAAHVRAAYGFNEWFEGGLALDASSTALGAPLASDMPTHAAAQALVRFGPQLRFAPRFGDQVRAGALIEGELGLVPYRARTTLTRTERSWYENLDTTMGDGGGEWMETVTVDVDVEAGSLFAFTGRTGVFLAWTPPAMHIGAGAALQVFPVFGGYARQHWDCQEYSSGRTTCDDVPPTPDLLIYRMALTPWVEAAVPIGDVWIVGSGWVWTGGDGLGSPGGGQIGVRWAPKGEG